MCRLVNILPLPTERIKIGERHTADIRNVQKRRVIALYFTANFLEKIVPADAEIVERIKRVFPKRASGPSIPLTGWKTINNTPVRPKTFPRSTFFVALSLRKSAEPIIINIGPAQAIMD